MAETVAEREYRRGWVHITDQALLDLLPVPTAARLVAVRYRPELCRTEFLLDSDEYPLVHEGCEVRVVSPSVEHPSEDEEE